MVNNKQQTDWSSQFMLPTSQPENYYATNYPPNSSSSSKHIAILYDDDDPSSDMMLTHETVNRYTPHVTINQKPVDLYPSQHSSALSSPTPFYFPEEQHSSTQKYESMFLAENNNSRPSEVTSVKQHLDDSFLMQHNQHMEQQHIHSNSEEGKEDEPVIGDGARSYSSVESSGSRRSQKLSKEDKRKRNTAASARFRIKKKMREKALQSTACEMTEKAKRMEQKVHELEREIKWLKALIVEKDDARLEELIKERPAVSIAFPMPSTSRQSQQPSEDEEDENSDEN